MSQPGFFFYTGDWLKDTRVLSPALRGAWIDLLCVLHEHGGEITWTEIDFARFWTVDVHTAADFVLDLSRLKVADVTIESQDKITIVCRRMKRVKYNRENNRLRKRRERDKKGKFRDSHAPVTEMSTRPSSSSSLSSSLKSHKSKNASPSGFAEFWNSYPNKTGKGHAEKAWSKLNPSQDLIAQILAAIDAQKKWRAGRAGNSKLFTPEWKHPATWLNAKAWEDVLEGSNGAANHTPAPILATTRPELTEAEHQENLRKLKELTKGIGKPIPALPAGEREL